MTKKLIIFFAVLLVCGILYFVLDIPAVFALIAAPIAGFFRKEDSVQKDLENKEKEIKETLKAIEEEEKRLKEEGVEDKSAEAEKDYWKNQ